jgi:hypothetical protein
MLLVPTAVAVAGGLLALRLRMEPPTVPSFSISGDGGVVALGRGERFELTIVPGAQVTGAIGARGFLVRGSEVRPWDPPLSVARDGTVTLAGPAGVLFEGVPPGEWDVAVAVGRPETLPTAPRDILLAVDADAGAGDRAWRLVRQRITLGG